MLPFARTIAALLLIGQLANWAHAQVDLLAQEEEAMQAAAAAVAPSVVRIETVGGLERVGSVLVSEGPTTGLIVSADGYILSSAFNFLGQPATVLVTLADGTRKPATIVARDHSRMMVLLKIEVEEELPVAEIVPREEIIVGTWAIALGRAHEGPGTSLSAGIISALDRIWDKAVQTDAKISPNNYGGPLIDIRGRVIGILTPLSPQGSGQAAAGAEWYDSGIGFAVPLADLLPHLDRLKSGEDLREGILGVSLKGSDIYNEEAIIANVRPNSPAYEAGLAADDRIVEADGKAIARQSQLKHALGGKYAGEIVELVVMRGEERLAKSITLTDKLEPFAHAFLGILPRRENAEEGVAVRHVFAASPAAMAGVQQGDRLVAIGGERVADFAQAMAQMNARKVGEVVEVTVVREGNEQQLTLTLGSLSSTIPEELPALDQSIPDPRSELSGTGEIKLPEESSTSFVYVPETYNAERRYGLLVWLQPPGAFEEESLLKRWKPACEERGLILLAPHPQNSARWLPTEVEFVRKSIAAAQDRYAIDSNRIVVVGDQGGGSMAYLVALAQRELIRGAAGIDSAVPLRGPVPENEPTQRLSIYSAVPADSKLGDRIETAMKVLQEKKFPVATVKLPAGQSFLVGDSLAEFLRWVDSLDRL